ncbi:leucyl aminopeptidase [Hyphobacterium sp. HN65]|uniref:Probable cytosol aminopeptidase n=1 Tax=Hyphobacterium lacteum TaxID=3116575 RepID=A0ABU7LLH3_9PROT|nr:leucyl aminopeptidase [Hyphobacterium sp. HN65]MEE2524781.1 leucyl aminopeptidase [Hyphobacterium sp. HN65]
MEIKFAAAPKSGSIAVAAFEKAALSDAAKAADKASGGAISRAIKGSRFKGGAGETLVLSAPSGIDGDRVVVFGVGKKKTDGNTMEQAGAGLTKALLTSGEKALHVDLAGVCDAECAARFALGAMLAAYRFDKYRTKLSDDKKPSLSKLTIATDDMKAAKAAWTHASAVADGVYIARDLVNEAPNFLRPPEYAKRVEKLADLGLEIEILGEKEMKKLGMHSLLGVGQGSVAESKIAIMKWNGGKKDDKPLAFIGKGVTFDTGGISLKPGQGMDEMKGDMGGSAAVVGLMASLAKRKAKVNAVGLIGLVENMPDGDAQRPGDIVTSMSGQTIEILNTDAEGRLVLADVLWYAQDKYDPEFMIDLATLTGAILISLGHEHAGIFSNNDKLADTLTKAGLATDEKVWRLPIGPEYDRQIDSPVADMKNIGEGRFAGSITAAQFLQRFVNDKPWVHIDIAGTGMWSGAKDARLPTFGTGYGVRLLDRFVADNYEK